MGTFWRAFVHEAIARCESFCASRILLVSLVYLTLSTATWFVVFPGSARQLPRFKQCSGHQVGDGGGLPFSMRRFVSSSRAVICCTLASSDLLIGLLASLSNSRAIPSIVASQHKQPTGPLVEILPKLTWGTLPSGSESPALSCPKHMQAP